LNAALLAGLAGIIGLVLGRFWDFHVESARWRRDQRIRTYELIGTSYYTLREAIRALALVEPGSQNAEDAASRALDLGGEFHRAIVTVWLHGFAPVATAVREIDGEMVRMFRVALSRRFSWEEWRSVRVPAERALESFIVAARGTVFTPARSLDRNRFHLFVNEYSLPGVDRSTLNEQHGCG
jgi:hypothetical protein